MTGRPRQVIWVVRPSLRIHGMQLRAAHFRRTAQLLREGDRGSVAWSRVLEGQGPSTGVGMGNHRRFSRLGRILALGYLGLVTLVSFAAYVGACLTHGWTMILLVYCVTRPTCYVLDRLRSL